MWSRFLLERSCVRSWREHKRGYISARCARAELAGGQLNVYLRDVGNAWAQVEADVWHIQGMPSVSVSILVCKGIVTGGLIEVGCYAIGLLVFSVVLREQ